MPFCANCGAPVEGQFCPKCGTALGAGAPPVGSANPQPAMVAGQMADNVAAALCYVLGLITGILFLVLAPYNQNKTIRFHAFQSIFLHAGVILIWLALGVMSSAMHVLGMMFLSPLYGLACFVLWIYMIVSAYQGKKVVLPVVGPLAQQQA